MYKKLFPLIALLLFCVSAHGQDFKGNLFGQSGAVTVSGDTTDGSKPPTKTLEMPSPSPTPVEIASRNEAFTKRLAADAFHNPLYAQMYSSFASSFLSSTFAGLGAPADGSVRYCSDCQATSPCTGSGSGATASRVNGAWNCSTGGSGSSISGLTTGTIPKAASATTLTDSPLSVSGSNVTVAANVIPDAAATRDVGSRTNPYATLHVRTALEFNAATGDNNSFSYSDQIGPVFHDDNVPNNLIFNIQGLTGSKTATWPNASGNVVLDAATQTLTNKSIDAGQLTGSVLDARLSANVPLINGTNAFTGTNSFSQPVGIGFGSTAPPSGPMLSVASTVSTSPRGIASMQFSTDTAGARLGFFKARGTPASPTTVVSGDTLGRLMFRGYDGSVYNEMASIEALSAGTVGSLRVPTQLIFATGTDAAPSVLTTALTLGADQSATFPGTVVATSPKITTGINDANGNSMLAFSPTASAANSVTLTNGAAGTPAVVTVSATGASASIDLALAPKNAPTGVVRTTGRFVAAGANGAAQLLIRDTTNSKDWYFYNNNDSLSVFNNAVNQIFTVGTAGSPLIPSNQQYGFSSTSPSVTSADTGLARSAVKVVAASDGATANAGWFTDAGSSRVSTQFDKTDTTLANVTGLSVNVQAGRTYFFRAVLHLTLDATGGQKVAIAGTCTATSIIYQVNSVNNSTNLNVINSRQTALAGAASAAGGTADFTTIEGTITVANAGTLTVQFSESAATGTGSVLVGSVFIVRDTP